MTLIDSTVSDNHASSPAQSNGGGIAVHSGASLSLRGSRVSGNSAAATAPNGRFVSGGGIFVNGGATLRVDDSSIDDNASLQEAMAGRVPPGSEVLPSSDGYAPAYVVKKRAEVTGEMLVDAQARFDQQTDNRIVVAFSA